MGAWGSGPFENDGVLDLLASMRHRGFSFEDIAWAFEDDYLEIDGGQYAIALVEIALTALGERAADPALEGVNIASLRGLLTPNRLAWVVAMADRTLEGPGSSELYELWEETEFLGEWLDPATKALDLLRTEVDKLAAD